MARLLAACVLLTLLVAMASSPARADDPTGGAGIRQLKGYGRGRKVGARTEVRDVAGDREVQELGRFSVAEHNRRRECRGEGVARLEFSRVVAAQRQVVSGLMYYLTVAAVEEDGGEERVFDAQVVVKPWLESRTLLKFAPSTAK